MLYSRISSLFFWCTLLLGWSTNLHSCPRDRFLLHATIDSSEVGMGSCVSLHRRCSLHDCATRIQSSNQQYRPFPKAFESLWERSSWWRAKLQDLAPLADRLSRGPRGMDVCVGKRTSKPFLAPSRSLPLFLPFNVPPPFHHPSPEALPQTARFNSPMLNDCELRYDVVE